MPLLILVEFQVLVIVTLNLFEQRLSSSLSLSLLELVLPIDYIYLLLHNPQLVLLPSVVIALLFESVLFLFQHLCLLIDPLLNRFNPCSSSMVLHFLNLLSNLDPISFKV